MQRCIEWCAKMKTKASEEGNFTDWSNYDKLEAEWRERYARAQK